MVVGARFEVRVETLDDGILLVRVEGEIDMATTPDLVERLIPAAELPSTRGLIVDLSEVGFMGAAGLHALEDAQARLRRHDGRLAVVAPSGIPRRVLAITGTERVLGVVGSLEAARAKLA